MGTSMRRFSMGYERRVYQQGFTRGEPKQSLGKRCFLVAASDAAFGADDQEIEGLGLDRLEYRRNRIRMPQICDAGILQEASARCIQRLVNRSQKSLSTDQSFLG